MQVQDRHVVTAIQRSDIAAITMTLGVLEGRHLLQAVSNVICDYCMQQDWRLASRSAIYEFFSFTAS